MSSAFTDLPVTRERGPNGWSILVFMGLGMLAGVLFLSWLGTPRIVPAVGQRLARLELAPLAFTDQSLSEADLLGKITVLHFWGTWCPQCMTEFPEFTKMTNELKDKNGLQVLSVASSEGPEYDMEKLTSEIREYLKEQRVEMPTYADPAGLTRGQAAMLMPDTSLAYPCTFVLDQEGIVRGTWTGYQAGNLEQAKQMALRLWKEI